MVHPNNVTLFISKKKRHENAKRNLGCELLNEKANLKRLHTVKVKLHDILEKAKLWRQ